MIEIEEKYLIAIEACLAASKKIMDIYETDFSKELKNDGSPVTEADLNSSKTIKSFLDKTKIPIIGEELQKVPFSERKNWQQCWCVDPLDGTKEFIKKNGEFVINIALIENHKPIFGIIAQPVNKKLLFGGKALNGVYLSDFSNVNDSWSWELLNELKAINNPPVIISSRSHFSGDLEKIGNRLKTKYGGYKAIKMGSALKFFSLCTGRADIYPRLAPTMEWDIAAGQAIYEFLGGEILDFKTKESLSYNKESLYNPYFIAKPKRVMF